jgi:glutathione S-transferase
MPEIVLHQWEISPFCGKVRRILHAKGLSFQVREYPGILARKGQGLTKAGKLPVMDYDGERIPDSSRIAAFLEERHPAPPLVPRDPRDRALAHLLEDWADESLYWFEVRFRMLDPEARKRAAELLCAGRPAVERAVFEVALGRMYRSKLDAQGLGRLSDAEAVRVFETHMDALEALLDGRDFLVGGAVSLADIAVASQLAEIQRTSPLRRLVDERLKVARWIERMPAG